jgi:hypothetical protein
MTLLKLMKTKDRHGYVLCGYVFLLSEGTDENNRRMLSARDLLGCGLPHDKETRGVLPDKSNLIF